VKRWLLTLGLFVLAGAIVNIAVAWFCAYCAPPLGRAVSISSAEAKAATPAHRTASAAEFIEVMGTRVPAGQTELCELFVFYRESTDDAGWIRYANRFLVWQAGWPCRSMRGWTAAGRAPLAVGTHGLWRLRLSGRTPPKDVFVPLLPLWPGFAVNTVLYAAIPWLLLAIPAAIRRRRRMRGLCPACRYPVGTSSVCTECGKPVKLKAVGHPA
jgi:hypothetical protein